MSTARITHHIRPTASGRYEVWRVWPSPRRIAGDRPMTERGAFDSVDEAARWIAETAGDDARYKVTD